MNPLIGLLTLHIHLPGCASLKEKRGRLSPLINRLGKQFSLSVAEIEYQDVWQSARIGCAIVNSDAAVIQRILQHVVEWTEENFPDLQIVDTQFEFR